MTSYDWCTCKRPGVATLVLHEMHCKIVFPEHFNIQYPLENIVVKFYYYIRLCFAIIGQPKNWRLCVSIAHSICLYFYQLKLP